MLFRSVTNWEQIKKAEQGADSIVAGITPALPALLLVQKLLRKASSVGLEPVAVAERNANEVWVVNHLSDSVSVVRLDGTPRVLRTLLVGDEPRDVVFAGTNRNRAFVTAANRGQNRPGFTSASLTTPGNGRADVWIFDAEQLDESLNGKPLTILTLPADVPREIGRAHV